MDEALKRYIAKHTGIPAAEIEQVSTYDNHYDGCDTCGHGGGYELTISYMHAGTSARLEIEGWGITALLNQLLEV